MPGKVPPGAISLHFAVIVAFPAVGVMRSLAVPDQLPVAGSGFGDTTDEKLPRSISTASVSPAFGTAGHGVIDDTETVG